MDKLESGKSNFTAAERELMDRLKRLSLGSERRAESL